MDNLTEDIIVKDVSFLVHEGDMTRMERTIQRQWVTIIILIVAMISMFVGFVIYEKQFEDVSITAEQTADTGNNYAIGGDYNGIEAESHY